MKKEYVGTEVKQIVPENNAVSTYLNSRNISSKTIKEFDIRTNYETRSIVFPVHEGKKLVGWIERRLDREPKYKYSKGFPRNKILFNEDRVKDQNWVAVVEGIFDCIYLHQAGVPTVSTLGSQVSEEQLRKLDNFNMVIVIPDRDEAGEKMAWNLAEKLGDKCYVAGLDCYKVKDVNELTVVQVIDLAKKLLEVYCDFKEVG